MNESKSTRSIGNDEAGDYEAKEPNMLLCLLQYILVGFSSPWLTEIKKNVFFLKNNEYSNNEYIPSGVSLFAKVPGCLGFFLSTNG